MDKAKGEKMYDWTIIKLMIGISSLAISYFATCWVLDFFRDIQGMRKKIPIVRRRGEEMINFLDRSVYLISGSIGGFTFHDGWYIGIIWIIAGIGLWEFMKYEDAKSGGGESG